jgi:nucleotide-binding universal stress UspA family protein
MYQTILVPLDGSQLAEEALVHAEAIARRFAADLLLFHSLAADSPLLDSPPMEGGKLTKRAAPQERVARDYLMHIRQGFLAKGIKTQIAIGEGSATDEILRHIAVTPVSLIVISSHGRSGLSRAVMGSVADELMRRSSIPVLVVKNLAAGVQSAVYDADTSALTAEPGFAT